MIKLGDKSGTNVFGGFGDTENHLLTTVKCGPLLPLAGGESGKAVLSVHLESLRRVVVLYREHMGYFMEDSPQEPADEDALKGMCWMAKMVLDAGAPSTAQQLTTSEPSSEFLSTWDPLETPWQIMSALVVACDSMGHVTSSLKERKLAVIKAASHQLWFPANLFQVLAPLYLRQLMAASGPGDWIAVRAYAGLLVTKALPLDYTKKVFKPLFVPKFYTQTVTKDFEGEPRDFTDYGLRLVPFKGFGFKGESMGCVAWDGLDNSGEVAEQLPLLVTGPEPSLELYSLRRNVLTTLESLSPPTDSPYGKLLAKLRAEDEDVHSVDFMHHGTLGKAVRRFFGTDLGVGFLQSQVSLCTPRWNISDVMDRQLPEEELIRSLCAQSHFRASKLTGSMEQFCHNAFNVEDANCQMIESRRDGSVAKLHRIVYGAAIGKPCKTACHRHMDQLGLHTKAFVVQKPTSKVMMYGLWSPYNSTECSDWGNLKNTAPGTPSNSLKTMPDCLDSKTYRSLQYEIKTIPINEPGNVLGWTYNARLALLSTMGAMHAVASDVDAVGKTQVDELIPAVIRLACKETVRGLMVRTKTSQGDTGLTFDLIGAVMTSKTGAIVRSDKAPPLRSSGDFQRLQWQKPTSNDSQRIKYMHATYPMKSMLEALNREMGFFYKRLVFFSPRGNKMVRGAVHNMKKQYIHGPTAFLAAHTLVDNVANAPWFTTAIESVEMWTKIDVLRVAIEQNTVCYSEAVRATWSSNSDQPPELTWQDVAAELMENYPGIIKTSYINMSSLTRAVFSAVVDNLKQHGRYEEDCEPQYAECEDEVAAEEHPAAVSLEDPTEGTSSEGGVVRYKRGGDLLATLENSILKRKKLMEDE